MQHEAPRLPLTPDCADIPTSTYITPGYLAFGDLNLGTKNWKVQLWPSRLGFDPFYFKTELNMVRQVTTLNLKKPGMFRLL